jgi:protein-S-isoprenylcysteine O-methyltransferase Ste14
VLLDGRCYNARVKPSARSVTIVPIVVLAAVMISYARPSWTPLRLAGLALAIFGFTMLTIARFQLGNAFSVTPQANMLVTRGIYSRIRHPVYVFSAIGIAGLFLYLDLPRLLVLLVAIIPMQVVRARREERVLDARFGEEYRTYKHNTWF